MQHKSLLISMLLFVLLSTATNSFSSEPSNSSSTTTTSSASSRYSGRNPTLKPENKVAGLSVFLDSAKSANEKALNLMEQAAEQDPEFNGLVQRLVDAVAAEKNLLSVAQGQSNSSASYSGGTTSSSTTSGLNAHTLKLPPLEKVKTVLDQQYQALLNQHNEGLEQIYKIHQDLLQNSVSLGSVKSSQEVALKMLQVCVQEKPDNILLREALNRCQKQILSEELVSSGSPSTSSQNLNPEASSELKKSPPVRNNRYSGRTRHSSCSSPIVQAAVEENPSLLVGASSLLGVSSVLASVPLVMQGSSSLLSGTRSSLATSSSVLSYKSGLENIPSILEQAPRYKDIPARLPDQTATEYAHVVMQHATQQNPNLSRITESLAQRVEAEKNSPLSTQPTMSSSSSRIAITSATVIFDQPSPVADSRSRAELTAHTQSVIEGPDWRITPARVSVSEPSSVGNNKREKSSSGSRAVAHAVTNVPQQIGVAARSEYRGSVKSTDFSRTQTTPDGYIKSTPATLTTNVSMQDGQVASIVATGQSFEGRVNPMPKGGFCLPSPTRAILAASIGRTTAAGAQYYGATQTQAQYANIATTVAASAVMHCCRSDQENRTVVQFLIQLALDGICYTGINWLLPVQKAEQKEKFKELTKSHKG